MHRVESLPGEVDCQIQAAANGGMCGRKEELEESETEPDQTGTVTKRLAKGSWEVTTFKVTAWWYWHWRRHQLAPVGLSACLVPDLIDRLTNWMESWSTIRRQPRRRHLDMGLGPDPFFGLCF